MNPSARKDRRAFIESLASLAAGSALSGCTTVPQRPFKRRSPDLVHRENSRPGTRDWMLQRTAVDPKTKYRCPWIEGYCSQTSLRHGQTLTVHVSTHPASDFRADVYRLGYYSGHGGRHVATFDSIRGKTQEEPPIGPARLRDCTWDPSFQFTIPEDWTSGVYLVKLTTLRDGWQSYAIFIVRDDREADFMFQCSDTTWQAYNRWPSQFSLYDDGRSQWYWGDSVRVGFNRPYGKYCQILDAPLSTGSGEFLLWEFPTAFWLEAQGYDVTYVSNLDTHRDPRGLRRVKGFLSVGHDEYWSIEMFEQMHQAVGSGLNIAFLSGNTCCGRIGFSPDSKDVGLRTFERLDVFSPPDPPEPFDHMASLPHRSPNANQLIGARSIPPVTGGADWICQAPNHWIFQNTGMKQGDAITGLVGWEWHGDPASIPGLEIVAHGPTFSAPGKPNGGKYTATIYPGPRGNHVFNASTIWWGDALSEPPGYLRPSVYVTPKGPDPRAQQITRNLMDRFRKS